MTAKKAREMTMNSRIRSCEIADIIAKISKTAKGGTNTCEYEISNIDRVDAIVKELEMLGYDVELCLRLIPSSSLLRKRVFIPAILPPKTKEVALVKITW